MSARHVRPVPAEDAGVRPPRPRPSADRPAFLSISDAAALLGVSTATLYRAISEGQFPAVRIRDRVIIPARAIESLTEQAIEGCSWGGAYLFGGTR